MGNNTSQFKKEIDKLIEMQKEKTALKNINLNIIYALFKNYFF